MQNCRCKELGDLTISELQQALLQGQMARLLANQADAAIFGKEAADKREMHLCDILYGTYSAEQHELLGAWISKTAVSKRELITLYDALYEEEQKVRRHLRYHPEHLLQALSEFVKKNADVVSPAPVITKLLNDFEESSWQNVRDKCLTNSD